jgi:hypothetical protein
MIDDEANQHSGYGVLPNGNAADGIDYHHDPETKYCSVQSGRQNNVEGLGPFGRNTTARPMKDGEPVAPGMSAEDLQAFIERLGGEAKLMELHEAALRGFSFIRKPGIG